MPRTTSRCAFRCRARRKAKASSSACPYSAGASLTPIEGRNPANQYNWVSIADANKVTPHFDWAKFLAAEKITGVDGFSLSQPKFFAEFDKMLAEVPAADWQAYLRYHALNDAAAFLSDNVDNESFGFYGTKLNGQPEQRPRWKRVLGTINGSLGEALDWLRNEPALAEVLGKEFITVYAEVKEIEYAEFMKVISPWEREHLLLHV